jgi:uncharacterized membrane protein YedE/YeeE
MENFTPIASTLGGALIGLSAAMLLLLNGRIAGISGILSGAVQPDDEQFSWKLTFVAGLLVGGIVMWAIEPQLFAVTVERSYMALAIAGVLVGVGTRLGNGCTSGHGVCGLSRFSLRSLIATVSFMVSGAVSVFVINHLLGGSL